MYYVTKKVGLHDLHFLGLIFIMLLIVRYLHVFCYQKVSLHVNPLFILEAPSARNSKVIIRYELLNL